MGCCAGCARALLISFNFFFWLSGVAILGVGIWMLVDKNISSYFTVAQIDSSEEYFKYAAYLLCAFGCFIFIVGFAGCCGAIRKSKILLALYLFSLVLIFAGEIAAGIVMVIYRVEMSDKFDNILSTSIKENFGKSDHEDITAAWNLIQIREECCGGKGAIDYENVTFPDDDALTITQVLPKSCCILANKEAAMENVDSATPLNATGCLAAEPGFYHEQDCKDKLFDWMISHTGILIGVGFGVGVIQILGFVFAICVWRDIGTEKY